jgi:membrane-associated phospholipid phosphatase
MTTSAAGAAISLAVLGVLAAWLLADAGPMVVDRSIADAVADQQEDWRRRVWRVLALPGTKVGALALALAAGCYFWISQRTLTPAMLLVVAYAGAFSTAFALKRVVDRVAPRFWLERDTGVSFPSSHAARAAAVLGMIVVIVAMVHGRRAAAVSSIVALVGISVTVVGQIYLRVHWFTDMIGGLAIGVFWVALLVPLVIGRLPRTSEARASPAPPVDHA